MRRLFLFALLIIAFGCEKKSEDVKRDVTVAPNTGYVDIESTKLYYEELGQGQPVIMIHGGFLDRRMWDGQFEVFAEQYRAIRYDVRGHGLSDSDSATFNDYEDLYDFIDQLKIEKAVIMGLSMGGLIAVDFALEYPERVSALILVGPGISGYNIYSAETQKYIDDLVQAFNEDNFDKITEIFIHAWTDGPHRSPSEVNPAVREKVKTMFVGSRERWRLLDMIKDLDPPAFGRLAEIKIPTLTILGEIDMPDIIDIVNRIEDRIAGAQKFVIPGVAHMVNMEKPEEFNRVTLDFLSKL